MKKLLAVLLVIVFGMAVPAFAAGKVLSSKEMDQVSAGDWIVIDPNTQAVVDVYSTNNTLDLLDESQTNVQAVSNANVIDGAGAVQSNVLHTSGSAINMSGANVADLTNYRPGASSASNIWNKSVNEAGSAIVTGSSTSNSCNFGLLHSASSELSSSASASASSYATKNLLATYDELCQLAATSTEVGKSISKGIVLGQGIVKAILTDVEASGSAAASASALAAKASESCAITGSESASTLDTSSTTITTNVVTESDACTTTRDSKGANNHIALLDKSQQAIQAVSNLNLVGGAAAIQANAVDNSQITGTLTFSNSATVVSGL